MDFLQEYTLIVSVPVPCATNTGEQRSGRNELGRAGLQGELQICLWKRGMEDLAPHYLVPLLFFSYWGLCGCKRQIFPLNYLLFSATSQHMCEHEGDFSGCPT